MNSAAQVKDERINLRLKQAAKALLERAASFEGQTVSKFILKCALAEAEKTVQEHEAMSLTARDSERFFDALDNSTGFNDKLQEAMEEHGRRVISK